jgi:hypothetical protein
LLHTNQYHVPNSLGENPSHHLIIEAIPNPKPRSRPLIHDKQSRLLQLDAITTHILQGGMTASEVFREIEVPFSGIVLVVVRDTKAEEEVSVLIRRRALVQTAILRAIAT